jgi:hypothetical protein
MTIQRSESHQFEGVENADVTSPPPAHWQFPATVTVTVTVREPWRAAPSLGQSGRRRAQFTQRLSLRPEDSDRHDPVTAVSLTRSLSLPGPGDSEPERRASPT